MKINQDEKGFYFTDYDFWYGEKVYFNSRLSLVELMLLPEKHRENYIFANECSGIERNFPFHILADETCSMIEEIVKMRIYLKNLVEAIDLATSTGYGGRDTIGQGYDEKIKEVKEFLNASK